MMENRPAQVHWFWRYGPLTLSFLLYLLCLPFEAFCQSGQCSDWPAYAILLFGHLGLLASVTNWTWLANPALFAAWVAQVLGARIVSAALSSAAFVIALCFLFQHEIMTNEAGTLSPITGYRIGYWIWLSSIAVFCFGTMATIKFFVGSKNKE